MKKILVPLDFTETSENAFIYALELAALVEAELVLLHTFELPVVDSHVISYNYATIYNTIELTNFDHFREAMPKLRALAAKRKLDHIGMSHILMDGELLYNIRKIVDQESIDMVVMGTNGAEGWIDTFLGTNTGAVISHVEVPVFCVPSGAKFEKIKTIAFTTRFRQKDFEALDEVLAFAKQIGAQVKCLYVKTVNSDVKDDTIQHWKSYFKGENIQFFVIPAEDVQNTIEDFLTSQSIDLLATLTYKRSFFAELFSTSKTQNLSYHLKTPMLVLHE